MTNITINKLNSEYELIVEGHSGYAEHGKDIVCASISTLTFTWINQLREFERLCWAKITYFNAGDGKIVLKFETENKAVAWSFETVITGFLMISENFSQYLSVTRGEL